MENTTYLTGVEHQQYETNLEDGHYQLDVYPKNYFYQLTLPNGDVVEGAIPALITTLEQEHKNPKLDAWLLSCINWEEPNKKDDRQTKTFTIDGRKYSITFNVDTGMVNLHFPRMLIVADRKDIASPGNFELIHSVKQGVLSELIASIIADEGEKASSEVNINTQYFSDNMSYFEIEGWEVGIEYKPVSDIIFLDLAPRIVYSHIYSLPEDILELDTLNRGVYVDTVFKILLDSGMQVKTPKL